MAQQRHRSSRFTHSSTVSQAEKSKISRVTSRRKPANGVWLFAVSSNWRESEVKSRAPFSATSEAAYSASL
jgi:hypothetical protein